jgi:hypothetical protein
VLRLNKDVRADSIPPIAQKYRILLASMIHLKLFLFFVLAGILMTLNSQNPALPNTLHSL